MPGRYGRIRRRRLQKRLLKDTAGLKETAEGLRVRSSGGTLRVIDGPFTEAKEVVGGYALVEVKSKEKAVNVGPEALRS
jgi:hypothetical protein